MFRTWCIIGILCLVAVFQVAPIEVLANDEPVVFLNSQAIYDRIGEDTANQSNIPPIDEDRLPGNRDDERKEEWAGGKWMKALVEIAMESRKQARLISGILQRQLVEFLTVMLGIWMLLQVGKLLMAFGPMEGSGAKIMNTVFIRILLALIVVSLIRSPDLIWRIHEAVSTAGAGTAQMMLSAAAESLEDKDLADNECGDQFLTAANELITEEYGTESQAVAQLECTVDMSAKTLGVGLKIGIDLWTGKNRSGAGPARIKTWEQFKAPDTDRGARLIVLVAALALIYFFGSMMIAVPFRIIDVVFKWTIVTILAPVMLVAFLFPISRNIGVSGLKVLFHSAMTLIVLAAMISIIFSLMIYVLSQSDYDTLAKIYSSDEIVEEGIASQLLIYMIFIGLFGKAMIDQAPAITSRALSIAPTLKIPELGQKMFSGISGAIWGMTGGAAGSAINRNMKNRSAYNKRITAALGKARAKAG